MVNRIAGFGSSSLRWEPRHFWPAQPTLKRSSVIRPPSGDQSDTFADRQADHDTGWLGEIAKNQPEDAMVAMPPTATDPFMPIRNRLQFIIKLYRFEPTGGKLIDWAVAQTGMDDPLARFNRHELEQFFDRWMWERDRLLVRTLDEARKHGESVDDLVSKAPNSVRRGIKRISPAG